MPQEKTEAVVVRGVDFSETSRIVTFLTPQRGLMVCMAKGARRKNSPVAAALDAMNRVELVYYWKDGRRTQQMGEVSILDTHSGLKKDLERHTFAAFPLELAYRTAHENEPSEVLYATLTRGLAGLDAWRGDARLHCCWQVMQLLGAAGFAPSLDVCVRCGVELEAAAGFAFEGGVTCSDCTADRRLSPAALACLRALQDAGAACPAVVLDKGVFTLLRCYAARHIETEFKSVRVIESMFG